MAYELLLPWGKVVRMSILKSATLEGVWGERDFRLVFHPDVNFLIGPNGSGKTTAINLIAAALSADHDSLSRIPFSKLTCLLQDSKEPVREHRVSVARVADRSTLLGNHYFEYEITRGGEEQSFELGTHPFRDWTLLGSQIMHPTKSQISAETLLEMVRIKWLSVHRTSSKARSSDAPSTDSSVDRRLAQLGNLLVRYFSKLAARRESETSRFLKQLFPILFSAASENDAVGEAQKIDLELLRDSITEVIQQFSLSNRILEKNLDTHFKLAETARDKQTYSTRELAALITCIPLLKVVEEWNRSVIRQENIARPRVEFLSVVNSMFAGKELVINQRNELEALLANNKHLALTELSSGEKQLLIIMAEALLQEDSEFIYIADEPELSLHVKWQEQLTRNLRIINPRAQVIFATHSPDIVSEYANRVIDMERLK